ncbi:hypothetical protein L7F22_050091 [Adiantum nelumboides]|nr:hypothetical protein [Adiantum nelumboides]
MAPDDVQLNLIGPGGTVPLPGSSLLLGRFMSSTVWGIVADRYGHKPVMYIGTASTFIFMTVFGFSTNYWIAILSRFLTGLANGMTATMRAYAAEVCSIEHQAFSMSIVGTMWGVGLIIGPAFTGCMLLAWNESKFTELFKTIFYWCFVFTDWSHTGQDLWSSLEVELSSYAERNCLQAPG